MANLIWIFLKKTIFLLLQYSGSKVFLFEVPVHWFIPYTSIILFLKTSAMHIQYSCYYSLPIYDHPFHHRHTTLTEENHSVQCLPQRSNLSLSFYAQTHKHFCKVEFIQPSCWLYSVPNLLVFQELVTLYLDEFVVRVMSEIEYWMLKSVQENRVSRLDLAGDSRLQAARSSTRAKHARSWSIMLVGALQDKIGQLAVLLSRDWISQLNQVARPSRELALFWKNLMFHIPFSPQYKYPLYPQKKESF